MKHYTKEQLATYFIDVLGFNQEDIPVDGLGYLKEIEQLLECREYLG